MTISTAETKRSEAKRKYIEEEEKVGNCNPFAKILYLSQQRINVAQF